jgi:hypothetical protein
MADEDSGAPDKRRQQPPPIEFLRPGETQTPPPEQQPPVAWVTRPEDYQQPAYPVAPAPPRPGAPGKYGLFAGILLFLAAGFGIASVVSASITPISYADYANLTNDTLTFMTNQICGIIVIMAQSAALLGGVMAIQRLNWKLTMVCAILATLTVGFYLEASFMGMLAVVLVAIARREFRS